MENCAPDILELDSICFNIYNRPVFLNVYMKAETGKVTGLIGREGSGKSTLINLLFGTIKCNDKSLRFNFKKLTNPFLNSTMNLLSQGSFFPSNFKLKKILYDHDLSSEAFNIFFDDKICVHQVFGHLSSGEKRLVEIFVLLMADTKFTILDSPFLGMSPLACEKIKTLILSEKKRKGIIVTDNNWNLVKDISDNIYHISDLDFQKNTL